MTKLSIQSPTHSCAVGALPCSEVIITDVQGHGWIRVSVNVRSTSPPVANKLWSPALQAKGQKDSIILN